jgi:hypothetical protein
MTMLSGGALPAWVRRGHVGEVAFLAQVARPGCGVGQRAVEDVGKQRQSGIILVRGRLSMTMPNGETQPRRRLPRARGMGLTAGARVARKGCGIAQQAIKIVAPHGQTGIFGGLDGSL